MKRFFTKVLVYLDKYSTNRAIQHLYSLGYPELAKELAKRHQTPNGF